MNITLDQISAAHERIKPFIHRTPVLTSESINKISGATLFLKCENFQKTGSFKIRGGMNAVLSLSTEELKQGIATHSSGNHAQAIAFAARQVGKKAYIVMPATSPKVKVDAVKNYGAEITFCEPKQKILESTLKDIIQRTGAAFVHPYDNYQVITGQATCAKELIEDVPGLDAIITPVGGGGLLSGSALSKHYLLPPAFIYAGEPEGAADAILSFRSGQVERAAFINTIADGLLTTLSDKTVAIIRQYVKDIFLVTEQEITSALRLIYERMKIIVEPSSAVSLAVVLKHRNLFAGKRIGIILTGGNVDVSNSDKWFKD